MMKKSMWVIAVLMLVFAMLPFTSQAAPLAKLSWRAEYYDNSSLAGQPKLVTFVEPLNIDWGHKSPAPEIPPDRFSARFTTTRHIEEGTYLFLLSVDDGARVWLDGQLIIDAWDLGPKQDVKAKIYIDKTGDHQLQVAYFEDVGRAFISLEWLKLGDKKEIVEAWRGEYFNNRDLAGDPTVVRQDGAINFDWNSGSPDPKIARDNFSVRWTRSIYLDRDGFYTFDIQHDDGMRIYVDGKIIYESWYDQGIVFKRRVVPIDMGNRTFVVEYYDHVGNAVAHVSIKGDPGDYGNDEPDPAGLIIDNNSPYFKWGGPPDNRFMSKGGYGTNYFWTYNTDKTPVNYGRWCAPLTVAGNYELFAYIPGDRARTTNARYVIQHFGQRDARAINQSRYSNEFVSLGIYYFGGSGDECVTLYDNTGETPVSTQVAFDAMKYVKR
jgi:hypothetical protein